MLSLEEFKEEFIILLPHSAYPERLRPGLLFIKIHDTPKSVHVKSKNTNNHITLQGIFLFGKGVVVKFDVAVSNSLRTDSHDTTKMQPKAFLVKKLWLWCLIAFVAEGFYSPAFTAVSSSSSSSGKFIEWHQLRGSTRKTSSISSTTALSITSSQSIGFDSLVEKHVLVVGGSGRVGGSVVTQLILRGARVSVGATNEENFIASQNRWVKLFPELEYSIMNNVSFVEVNREDSSSFEGLDKFLDFDLVVNTAGPFQGKVRFKIFVIFSCKIINDAQIFS